MPQYPFNDLGPVDEHDDAQGGAAADALERVDFGHFLNQPRRVGFAPVVDQTLAYSISFRFRCGPLTGR